MIAYLDTNVAVWLAQGRLSRISRGAQRVLERAGLLISPMVVLELEYLYEFQRIKLPARDLCTKLADELRVRVCDLPFPLVGEVAVSEKWTRDPFDRLIVAQAKANHFAPLISADTEIGEHYPRTVW